MVERASLAGLSLLFAPGKRPDADDIKRLVESTDVAGAAAHVTYQPPEDTAGFVELLISGLTYDLHGLAPAGPEPLPDREHLFGLNADSLVDLETVTLFPGHCVAGGAALVPVVQAMAGLVAKIALPLGARAVAWHPVSSWMEPQYFSRIVRNWLSGGAFPALGFTALIDEGAAVRSMGLRHFAGQEVEVRGREGEPMAETAKLAVRFIDHMVNNGPFDEPVDVEGPSGEMLRIEAGKHTRIAVVHRPGDGRS